MATETEFEIASRARQPGMAREFLLFLRENKKWWLLPIVILLAVIASLATFATTGAAPFIYTLF
jgi:drug/metabolite transporter superfamily protein YnfA